MARGDVTKVLAGVPDGSGGFWAADVVDSESYPKDATSKLEKFTAVGFISEDGVTETSERDVEKVKAWGGDTIRVLQNEHTVSYTLTFSELGNADVLKLIYGEKNVTEDKSKGTIAIKQNSDTLPHKSFVIEVLDGDTKIRKFIPRGQITETGELQLVHNAVMSIEVTIEAFPDKDNVKVYTWQSKIKPPEDEGEDDDSDLGV